MIKFEVDVVGGAEAAAAFGRVGSSVRARVRGEILALAQVVASRAQDLAPRASGKGAASITWRLAEWPGTISAQVFPRAGHMWIIGKGFMRQPIVVREHARKVKGGKDRFAAMVRVSRRRKRYELKRGYTQVSGYERFHAIERVPYMSEAFQPVREAARARLTAAVVSAMAESGGVSDGGGI